MNLNTFVAAYINKSLQSTWDYTGSGGWVNRANLILRDWMNKGYVALSSVKEVGVEVDNGLWITLPSDFIEVLDIFYPMSRDINDDPEISDKTYKFGIVNGKIKLSEYFGKTESPIDYVLSTWATTSVKITTDSGPAGTWNDWLLVITNGDLSGRQISISISEAVNFGKVKLNFVHNDGLVASTSTEGYLTDQFLMLKYVSDFTELSLASSTLPIDPKFYPAFAAGLNLGAIGKTDPAYRIYFKEYIDAMENLERNILTPTEDQARPKPRSLPGYQNIGANGKFPDIEDEYFYES